MPATLADKRAAFRKLHQSGCFIIPNPYDVGSARALQHLDWLIPAVLVLFVGGVIMASLRVTTGSLLTSIAAH